jgi:formylglycine-generating enzyme required for sulfatase activity
MKVPQPFVLQMLLVVVFCSWSFVSYSSQEQTTVKTKVNAKDGLTYVWIPAGTFQMGCSTDDPACHSNAIMGVEEPSHSVTITRGFWIGQTEVTQAAYKKVEGADPSDFKGDQVPVELVSWDEAVAYCGKVEMRLPTEAEWEYAARGGSPAARYGPLDSIAWYDGNSGNKTHEVAQKAANDYGVYDALGNVWEWVADWFGPYAAAAAVDPTGPASGTYRVIRGGSWHLGATFARVSFRLRYGPTIRFNFIGFRCAGN